MQPIVPNIWGVLKKKKLWRGGSLEAGTPVHVCICAPRKYIMCDLHTGLHHAGQLAVSHISGKFNVSTTT